ncbi:MAG: hypothetical protein ACLTER_08890 [Ruminococcus sp.]
MDDHGIEEEVTEPEGRSSVLADLKAKAAMVSERLQNGIWYGKRYGNGRIIHDYPAGFKGRP